MRRNQTGDEKMYVGPGNKGYKLMIGIYKNDVDKDEEVPFSIDGVQGFSLAAEECVSSGE